MIIAAAPAHYVTEVLDGPIIEQGVARISHGEFTRRFSGNGRDLEKVAGSMAH